MLAVAAATPMATLVAPPGQAGDGATLGVGAAAAIGLGIYLLLLARGRATPPSAKAIFAFGLLARLATVAGPQRVDDDLWRYLWDGAVTRQGISPYRFAPQEALEFEPRWDRLLIDDADEFNELAALHALTAAPPTGDIARRINFPFYPTIYPPASQLLFAATPPHERAARGLYALADVLAIGLLLAILRRRDRPAWWAIAYAWHPLPILEFAAAGHQDAAGIAAVLAAFLALDTSRRHLGGALIAVAAGTKAFPVGLLALWHRRLGTTGLAAAVATAIVLAWPFARLGPVDLAGWQAYLSRWEFFSGPYAVVAAWIGERWSRAAVALAGLGLLAALSLGRGSGRRGSDRLWRSSVWIEALVVLSPVVDPWYAAWPLATSALRRSLAWPFFAAALPIAYWPAPESGHSPWLRAAVWVPFLVAWAVELQRSGGESPTGGARRG